MPKLPFSGTTPDRQVISAQVAAAAVLCVVAYLLFIRADGPSGLGEINAPPSETPVTHVQPDPRPDPLTPSIATIPPISRGAPQQGPAGQTPPAAIPPDLGTPTPTTDQYKDSVSTLTARLRSG